MTLGPELGILLAVLLGTFVVGVIMGSVRRSENSLERLRMHLDQRRMALEQLNRSLETEIEERRQREKEMRRLLHNARCIVWSAEVQVETNGHYDWKLRFFEEEKLHDFVPLTLGPGQTWPDAWYFSRPPEDQIRTDQVYLDALKQRQTQYNQEFRVRRADGATAWIFEDVQVEYVDDTHYHLVGVCTDITEKKKAEEELKQIMKTARCLIWHAMVEDRGTHLHWNIMPLDERAAQEFLPLQVKPGETWHRAWFASWDPTDIERMNALSLRALREGRNGYSQEFRCRLTDGAVRWLYEDVHVEKLGEGKWHAVGVCTDVTKRKAAEKELEYVISGVHCLIWHSIVEETNGKLVWDIRLSNEETIQKFLPISVQPGQPWVEAWQASKLPEDIARMDAYALEALRAGKVGYSQEFRSRCADGEVRWLHEDVRIEPLRPGVWHLVGICADITQRKNVEQERERLIAELQEALKKVKLLSGLLPICAACKKVRDDAGYWDQIDTYLKSHSEVEISHSICPECLEKLYPEYK